MRRKERCKQDRVPERLAQVENLRFELFYSIEFSRHRMHDLAIGRTEQEQAHHVESDIVERSADCIRLIGKCRWYHRELPDPRQYGIPRLALWIARAHHAQD